MKILQPGPRYRARQPLGQETVSTASKFAGRGTIEKQMIGTVLLKDGAGQRLVTGPFQHCADDHGLTRVRFRIPEPV